MREHLLCIITKLDTFPYGTPVSRSQKEIVFRLYNMPEVTMAHVDEGQMAHKALLRFLKPRGCCTRFPAKNIAPHHQERAVKILWLWVSRDREGEASFCPLSF